VVFLGLPPGWGDPVCLQGLTATPNQAESSESTAEDGKGSWLWRGGKGARGART
jgi:hypothetical protein